MEEFVRAKIEKALAEAEAGNVIPQEEVRKIVAGWLKSNMSEQSRSAVEAFQLGSYFRSVTRFFASTKITVGL